MQEKKDKRGGARPGAGQPKKSGSSFNFKMSADTKAILEVKGKREKTAFVENAILHYQQYIESQIIAEKASKN